MRKKDYGNSQVLSPLIDKVEDVIIAMGETGEGEVNRIKSLIKMRGHETKNFYNTIHIMEEDGLIKKVSSDFRYKLGGPCSIFVLTKLGREIYRHVALKRNGVERVPQESLYFRTKNPERAALVRYIKESLEAKGFEDVYEATQGKFDLIVKKSEKTTAVKIEYRKTFEAVRNDVRKLLDTQERLIYICKNSAIAGLVTYNVNAILHEKYGAEYTVGKYYKQTGRAIVVMTLKAMQTRNQKSISTLF